MATNSTPPAVIESSSPRSEEPLFRAEALAERRTEWLGTVLLAHRPSHSLFATFAVLVTAAILGPLFFANYTRTARVNGWLVPQQGLVRIFAPQSGVITQLNAYEGMEVHKGAGLLALSTELQSTAMGATQEEIVRQLVNRRDGLVAERHLHGQLYEQQQQDFSERLAAMRAEQASLERELEIQRNRLQLAERGSERLRRLHERSLIVEQRWQDVEDNRLEQGAKLRELERGLVTNRRERQMLEAEIRALPLKDRTERSENDRNVAALEQELAQAEAQRQIVIPAPQDGTVTAIQAELGGNARTTVPLLSIVPAGSPLEARLFIPSTAIGFVRRGQRVLLRYQAFPYQKFGHYEGWITNVSRSAVSPGELAPELVGLTGLFGANEVVYPGTVTLASQTATAYGEQISLQPGMLLEADVVIERRRLFEWVLDPLYTLTGKWHG